MVDSMQRPVGLPLPAAWGDTSCTLCCSEGVGGRTDAGICRQ
jgi:hypothetical protein